MLTLITNDTAPTLTGTVSADVTGATLALHVRRPDKTVLTKTVTVLNAATGTWSAPWAAGDLSLRGTYTVEVQVTFSNAQIQTFATDATGRPISFSVRPEIA